MSGKPEYIQQGEAAEALRRQNAGAARYERSRPPIPRLWHRMKFGAALIVSGFIVWHLDALLDRL